MKTINTLALNLAFEIYNTVKQPWSIQIIKFISSYNYIATTYHHSHKKRKYRLETRAVYIEISLVSWNLPKGPKHQGSKLKNMASSEGDQLLARAFLTIMEKIETDTLQITKKWNWKSIFIHQGYFFRKVPVINASFAPN